MRVNQRRWVPVHQAQILVAELAGGQPPLHAPVLGVGHADQQAAIRVDRVAEVAQHAPGLTQVLQTVAEYPAVARKQRGPQRRRNRLDVAREGFRAVLRSDRGIVRVDVDADVLGLWRSFAHLPRHGAEHAADFDDTTRVRRHHREQLGVGYIIGRGLFHAGAFSQALVNVCPDPGRDNPDHPRLANVRPRRGRA